MKIRAYRSPRQFISAARRTSTPNSPRSRSWSSPNERMLRGETGKRVAMKFVERMRAFLKGARHAAGTEESLSGRCGCERRDVHQVDAIVKRAVSDFGGIRMLAGACAIERSRDPGKMPSDPIRKESSILIAAAKSAGCHIETKELLEQLCRQIQLCIFQMYNWC